MLQVMTAHRNASPKPSPYPLEQSSVDYQLLTTKIARLRAELHELGRANRKYFQNKRHSRDEREAHLRRQERIQQIKAELEVMLGNKALNDAATGRSSS